MQDTSSARLLERWREGEREAGEALLARHYPTVRRYFELNASWDAEELTQRTFLASLERVPDIRDPAAFPAFLIGVARRQLAMYLRSRRPVDLEANLDAEVGGRTGLSTLVARSRRQLLLLRALATLPQRDQTLLILTYWEELPSHTIAEAQAGKASTIRTQIERARARLRRRIDALGRGMPAKDGDIDELARRIRDLVAR